MKYLVLISIFILSARGLNAQSSSARFALDPLGKKQQEMQAFANNLHGAQQPFIESLDTLWTFNDSIRSVKPNNFSISPSGTLSGGFSSGSTFDALSVLSPGIEISGSLQSKISFGALYRYHRELPQDYIANFVDSLRVLPGIGFATKDEYGYAAHYSEFFLGYQVGKYFHFEAGRGKQFWGDGYHSVLLSTNASPYPYFRVTTRIWNLRYVVQWARMSDITGIDQFKNARHKFTTLHAISYNPIPRWNISLYEMVIWQAKDTLSNRGIEPSYLNPLIFYRPLEYAQGSADNVLLGLSTKVKVSKQQQLYAGVMLDEFVLDAMTNKLGWWANKFALQAGARSFDTFTKGLHFQVEYAKSRPFTYTHGSILQNYGHLNQSLAHPLGTNFKEAIFVSRYEKNRWTYLIQLGWAEYGRDQDGDNYGGNIFRTYKNPFRNYSNYITQGEKHHLWWQRVQASYSLKKNNLEVFALAGARQHSVNRKHTDEFFFNVGIRSSMTPLFNDF
jgi:hypothetical protein